MIADNVKSTFFCFRESLDNLFSMNKSDWGTFFNTSIESVKKYFNENNRAQISADVSSFFIDIPFIGKFLKGRKAGKVLKIEKNLLEQEIKVQKLEKEVSDWLGPETKLIRNKHRDPVFLSKDGTKRVRFDFNNSHGDVAYAYRKES